MTPKFIHYLIVYLLREKDWPPRASSGGDRRREVPKSGQTCHVTHHIHTTCHVVTPYPHIMLQHSFHVNTEKV